MNQSPWDNDKTEITVTQRSRVKKALRRNNNDHQVLHQNAKGGESPVSDEPVGHSLALINEFLVGDFTESDFFHDESFMDLEMTTVLPKPHLLKTRGWQLLSKPESAYAYVFTRRWTSGQRPPCATDNNGTLFVIAIRHRSATDQFECTFSMPTGLETGVDVPLPQRTMMTYLIDGRTDDRINIGLVLNVTDRALKASFQKKGFFLPELGTKTFRFVCTCRWTLIEPDGQNKLGFRHNCFPGVIIQGTTAEEELFRGVLSDYSEPERVAHVKVKGHDVLVPSAKEVEITSNLEKEAEFTIDETGPCVGVLFDFIGDLWRTAGIHDGDVGRWKAIHETCPSMAIPQFSQDLPGDIAIALGGTWHHRHVPKYWRGFEESPKALKRAREENPDETHELTLLELPGRSGPVCVLEPWSLTDHYFDSPDMLLFRNGGSLRLRCNARGWDLLNVKSLSVAIDPAATVRYCANFQLYPPKSMSPKDPDYAAAIMNLVCDDQSLSVREGMEAILHPPLRSTMPIVGRGHESSDLVYGSPFDLDPYEQFVHGPLVYAFTVRSTRLRFNFTGNGSIELSFDISKCGDKVTIGLEFGLNHAGATSKDKEPSNDTPQTSTTLEIGQSESGGSSMTPTIATSTLLTRLFDPYDLAQPAVSSATVDRTSPFLQLRDAILLCLARRFESAGIPPTPGLHLDYFRIAGFKANLFASQLCYKGIDRRCGLTEWPDVRVRMSDIFERPRGLSMCIPTLWKGVPMQERQISLQIPSPLPTLTLHPLTTEPTVISKSSQPEQMPVLTLEPSFSLQSSTPKPLSLQTSTPKPFSLPSPQQAKLLQSPVPKPKPTEPKPQISLVPQPTRVPSIPTPQGACLATPPKPWCRGPGYDLQSCPHCRGK